MDIAPLGFAIDTSGLDRGKRAAEDFARSTDAAATASDRLQQAQIAELRASLAAADQAARAAQAKLSLLRNTEGVSRAALEEAAALARSTKSTADATRAKLELAKAGEDAEEALKGVGGAAGTLPAVLQGVAREAGAMASTMGIGGAAGRIGMAGAMGAAQGSASRLAPALSSLSGPMAKVGMGVGALTVGYLALNNALADNEDRWASYQQQLVNTLGTQGAASTSLYAVVDLANEVGLSVDASLQSFNRFARAKEEIGATNEELILMTETIMKLGRSSGVEAGAMQGAMMQLSQALASGRLNGDELRSIMENMQPLAKAIAEGMGVGVGELKKMGAEGELTGQKIFEAILSQSGKANEEFEKMPKTVEQSKARMANAFDELGAHIGDTIGASKVMRTIIDAMTSPVDALNKAFRSAAEQGMAQAESKLEEMEKRIEKIRNQQKSPLEEARKRFDKDEFKRDDITKQITEMEAQLKAAQGALKDAQQAHYARAVQLTLNPEEIARTMALGARGKAWEKGALANLKRLGLEDFQQAEAALAATSENVDHWTRALAGARRELEAIRNPFEKLIEEADTLEEAMRRGAGGMVDMFIQAKALAEQTGDSVETVIAQLQRLEGLRAQREIGNQNATASAQAQLASELAGGANRLSAEAASEAAQWAFQKFGDQVEANRDIVDSYTQSLIALKQATEALGDATELARLRNQIEELGAVMGSGGGYAERLTKFNVGIDQFRRERATAPVTLPAVTTGGGFTGTPSAAGLPADIIAFFRGKGATEQQAMGIAAGIMSESSGDHNAYNRESGAIGLGQWLGPRKRGVMQRYGKGGLSRREQLEYLWYELTGGDHGGPAVLQATDAATVASRYIGGFMRPGKDTASGTARALRYLGMGIAPGTTVPGATMPNLTDEVIGSRRTLFNLEEENRVRQFMEGKDREREASFSLLDAVATGNPEAIREAELKLKVIEAQREYAPEYAGMVEDAVRDADAAERRLDAERQIQDMRRANDEGERRNAAARTGSPAAMRQLELELRIEEIRRSMPAEKQGAAIAEAKREDQIRQAGQLAQASAAAERQRDAMRDQLQIAGLLGDEARLANRMLEARNQLFSMGISLTSDQGRAYLELVQAVEEELIVLDKVRERIMFIQDTAEEAAQRIGGAFGDFLGDAAREGELNWKKAIRGIEDAFYGMLDRVYQQFVISPLMDLLMKGFQMGLNALFGSMGAGSGSAGSVPTGYQGVGPVANGAVFGGGVEPFAAGGIFNTPSRFMFGGGRQGLAGEGPGVYEAIMPLRRGPDGRLGVAAGGLGDAGGKTEVNIIDMRGEAGSEAVEVEERQTGDGMRQVRVMIRDAVRETTRSGSLDADMRGSYGITRQPTRR